jgi:hypothetical protein
MRKGISITVTPADRVRLQSIIGDRNSPEIIIVGCILARLMPSAAVHTNRSKSGRIRHGDVELAAGRAARAVSQVWWPP